MQPCAEAGTSGPGPGPAPRGPVVTILGKCSKNRVSFYWELKYLVSDDGKYNIRRLDKESAKKKKN